MDATKEELRLSLGRCDSTKKDVGRVSLVSLWSATVTFVARATVALLSRPSTNNKNKNRSTKSKTIR